MTVFSFSAVLALTVAPCFQTIFDLTDSSGLQNSHHGGIRMSALAP